MQRRCCVLGVIGWMGGKEVAPRNTSKKDEDAEFLEYCRGQYSFLEKEFGFRIVRKNKRDMVIQWKNETTGVWLTYEPMDNLPPYVRLCRLVDGKFCPGPGEMRPETVLHCYDSDDLIRLRLGKDATPFFDSSEQDDDGGSFWKEIPDRARKTRKCAGDVLRGDFSVFKKLDKVVKKRARKYAIEKWGERAKYFGWT